MKRWMSVCVLAVMAALHGCATSVVATDVASPVPSARILAAAMLQERAGLARVVVKRDSGFSGSACNTRLHVGGVAVADIATGEKVVLFLEPGSHILSVNTPGAVCPGNSAEVSAMLASGTQSTYRIGIRASMDLFIQPTAF